MAVFADTHAHLYLEAFDEDREEVIRRAVEAGVHYLFLPNIDTSSIPYLASLISQHPGYCFPMMGLHPGSVKNDFREQLGVIEMELRQNPGKYCAVGEIGIDLYWDKTFAKEQEVVFVRQLELALEFNLPVAIHTRNSMELALKLVEGMKDPALCGVFHCFSGNLAQANRAIELGFRLGIGGVVTFKNSGLQTVVEEIELEHLLLETDAPYLAPVPFRGQRNEPSYIPYIAEKLAELKKLSVEEVAAVTTESALKLFGLH
ncbi:MAG: TatD family hydrolase [bacterium]